jgi:hypothetical protein
LIHGIGHETQDRFLEGLLRVLALHPTTVTIHHAIPTATNPIYANVEEELAAHALFESLQQRLGDAVAGQFPDVEWVLRPNSWIVADRRFRQGRNFSLWYYSDNERIHLDMLSFGRFAHSNILGQICYENLSRAETYDPQEASYNAFRKTPAVDAALDLITDLVGDRRSDLRPIQQRYGTEGLKPLEPVLERLEKDGQVTRKNGCWETVETDGVFIDAFWPLLEAAMQQAAGPPTSVPLSRASERGIRVGNHDRSLLVFVESVDPAKPYFSQIGQLGIYYRNPNQQNPAAQEPWVYELMQDFLAEVRQLLDQVPNITPKQAAARLKARRRHTESQP